MGRTVLKKLNSSKGASITFALLAFLVCAVISAVLLASASAAAGRLSGLAAADRRYYAVTSAVQLFSDSLSESKGGVNTFSVERIQNAQKQRSISYYVLNGEYTNSGWSEYSAEGDPSYNFTFKALKPTEADPRNMVIADPMGTFLSEVSMYCIFGKTDSNNLNLVKDEYDGTLGSARTKTWDMTLKVGSEAGLTVDVKAELKQDGTLEITFSNTPKDDTDKDIYSEVLVLRPGRVDNTANPAVRKVVTRVEVVGGENGAYTETEHMTEITTKSTTLTWMVSEIKKG